MATRASNLVKILIINAVIFAFGVLILELIFGNWIFGTSINQLNLIKSTEYTFPVDVLYGPKGGVVHYVRDQFGLRGLNGSPADIDILTIGGSTTDQRYITEGQTWQDKLSACFAKKGSPLAIVNAGVDGQSTIGHVKNFELWFPNIPRFKPKFFLFYIGLNENFSDEDGNSYDSLSAGKNTSVTSAIRNNSVFYYLYRTIRGTLRASLVLNVMHAAVVFSSLRWVDKPVMSNHDALLASKLAAIKRRVEIVAKHVKDDYGARPIFVTQTWRAFKRLKNGTVLGVDEPKFKYLDKKLNGVDMYYLIKNFNRVTMDVCHATPGAICIDLGEELETEFDDADFYDFLHNTPDGAQKIGVFLCDKLYPLDVRR